MPTPTTHRHTAVIVHAVTQREGVPYEVQRKICKGCERLLEEKTVRRAAAA
jgi:RNase P subunit RPR2